MDFAIGHRASGATIVACDRLLCVSNQLLWLLFDSSRNVVLLLLSVLQLLLLLLLLLLTAVVVVSPKPSRYTDAAKSRQPKWCPEQPRSRERALPRVLVAERVHAVPEED